MSALALTLGLLAGLALGALYFGGLWWTVHRVPTWRRPERALLASFAIRALLVLPAFVALALQGPGPLVAALVGFLVARFAVQVRAAPRGGAP